MRPGKTSRLAALITKEFIHLRRDPRSLVIIFIMPLVMIFIFGNVLSFDLKKIETLIIDLDQSFLSRALVSNFAASPLYEVFSLETRRRGESQGKKAKFPNFSRNGINAEETAEKDLNRIPEFLQKENISPELDRKPEREERINLVMFDQKNNPNGGRAKNKKRAAERKPAEEAKILEEKIATEKLGTVSPTARTDYLAVAEEWLRRGKIKQYIYIPEDFGQRFERLLEPRVLVVIDGSDSNVANRVYQYNERLLAQFVSRVASPPGQSTPFKVEIKMYFNPEIISAPFIIPGLVTALMLMIAALLPSLSLAREKETGSVELLFVSPLRSSEIIVGKTIPYFLVSLVIGLSISIFARLFFGLEFRGSYLLLFIIALIYILSGLALGILISTTASSQKVAMIMTLLGTILPSIFLTGFIFPLESLPPLLRAISYFVPATYFLRVLRGVALKGASLEHFLFEASMLLGMSLFLLALASKKFQVLRKAKR